MGGSASESVNTTTTETTTTSYVDSFNETVNRVNNISNSGNFYLAVGGSKSLLENMSETVQGVSDGATTTATSDNSKLLLYAIAGLIVALLIWRKVKGN